MPRLRHASRLPPTHWRSYAAATCALLLPLPLPAPASSCADFLLHATSTSTAIASFTLGFVSRVHAAHPYEQIIGLLAAVRREPVDPDRRHRDDDGDRERDPAAGAPDREREHERDQREDRRDPE